MTTVYSDYTRAKIGWFFGLSGLQVSTLAITSLPTFIAISRQAWASAGVLLLAWLAVATLVVVPVRGRSATGWLTSLVLHLVGGLTKATRFQSKAATGQATELAEADLPGVLSGVEIHEGPPIGADQARWALVQNHATRTWSLTAAVVHPGIGMANAENRRVLGRGMADLLDLCSRTELIDELLIITRTVPDDGAERAAWVTRHRRDAGPELARQVNDDLHTALTTASVRTETFVTFVVPEGRLAKEAKEAGGGIDGRARVMCSLAGEVGAQLRGPVGMVEVNWMTSPELAAACRTGFAPGDRAGIVDALNAATTEPGIATDIPWALAGPSGADNLIRHYSHDAWNSISATLRLPVKGAVIGALAPVLTPTEPGERRSCVIAYPILTQATADKQSASSEWSADLGEELRNRAKVKQRAKSRDESAKVRTLDAKLARGSSMCQPYAVVTVTAPKTSRIAEFGRRLDSSVRRAGFAPLRLDLAQDAAFAASTVPLGVSLARGTH